MAYGVIGPHYGGLTGYKHDSYKGISYNNNRVESADVRGGDCCMPTLICIVAVALLIILMV